MIGDLPGFGPVWYNAGSLGNILSLAAVAKICRITMDTLTEASMIVHKHDGTKMKFLESKNGLYYYDAAKDTKVKSAYYTVVQLVSKNKSLYTRRQLKAADLANRLYRLVSRPSHAAFLHMIREHELRNCPITTHNTSRALKIYGTNVDTLRGKTTWTTPEHVPSNQIRPLPFEILDAHKEVTLCCVDLFLSADPFH
jgi:hypothetical protein